MHVEIAEDGKKALEYVRQDMPHIIFLDIRMPTMDGPTTLQHTLHTVSLDEGMIPMGVLMPFLIFVFVINPFLRLINPRYCLHSWELIIIVSILFVSSHTDEFLSRAISVFSVSHYMATPENLCREYALPHVSPYLVVQNPYGQLDWFYEGLPANTSIPWQIWIRPLFGWLSFFTAIGIGCITLATLMRKQWVDNERIPSPLHRSSKTSPNQLKQAYFLTTQKNDCSGSGFSFL